MSTLKKEGVAFSYTIQSISLILYQSICYVIRSKYLGLDKYQQESSDITHSEWGQFTDLEPCSRYGTRAIKEKWRH